jgi:hypothetical protein
MAISFVGSNTGSANGTAVTMSLPASLQGDMVLVISGATNKTTGVGLPSTAGYTTIGEYLIGLPVDLKLAAAYKFMGSTPDSSVTVTAAPSGMSVATLALVFRGVSSTTTLDVAATTGQNSGAVPTAPGITTTNANCYIVSSATSQLADTSVGSLPGGVFLPIPSIQRVHDVVDPNADITVAAAYKALAVAGFTNVGAWSTWTSSNYVSLTIALRPQTVSTDFNTVDKGNVTTAGKAIAELEKVAVNKATVAYNGRTINIPDSSLEAIFVDKYRVVITGKTVDVGDILRAVTVTQASVLYRGRTVTVRDIQFEDIPRYTVKGRGSGHWMETR